MNSYAVEKLFGAIFGMALSDSPLRERLRDAYCNHLIRLKPEHGTHCIEFDELLAELILVMTEVEYNKNGSADASTSELTDIQVQHWIKRICGLILLIDETNDGGSNARRLYL